MSSYSSVTASVIQLQAGGALQNMIHQLASDTLDVFSSAYLVTRPFAHGCERDSNTLSLKPRAAVTARGLFEVTRSFDLLFDAFMVVDLPGICNTAGGAGAQAPLTGADRPWYTNGVAAALLDSVSLTMGGHSISTLSGAMCYLFEEICGQPSKSVDEMIGRVNPSLPESSIVAGLQAKSSKARRLYLPLHFWFSSQRSQLSSALNLIGAQFQRCHIDVRLNGLASVIENAAGAAFISANGAAVDTRILDPIANDMLGEVRSGGSVAATATQNILTATDAARVTMDYHGITLSEEDRPAFKNTNTLSLMSEVHARPASERVLQPSNGSIDVTSFAKNLVTEIIIAARVADDGAGMAYGPLRFDGDYDATAGCAEGPLGTIDCSISGQARTPANMEAEMFNTKMCYIHHSKIPQHKGVYTIPISMYPEDDVVDSHANVSKLDSLTLRLTKKSAQTAPNPERNITADVYALSLNLLVEKDGMKAKYFV